MRRLAVLAALGLGLPASAAEYRRVTVDDGRVLLAEVADTTDTGLRLRLPQGATLVAFQDVVSIEEIGEDTWRSQDPWQLVVVPPTPRDLQRAPELADTLTAAVRDLPATVPVRPADLTTLPAEDRGRLARCGTDRTCLQGYLDRSGADVLVAARVQGPPDAPEIVVAATWAAAPATWREVGFDRPLDASIYQGVLRQAIETALHLEPRPLDLTVTAGEALPAPGPTPPQPGALPPAGTATADTDPGAGDAGPQPATEPATEPSAEPVGAALPTGAEDAPLPAGPGAGSDLADLDRDDAGPVVGPTASTLRALSWVPVPGTPSLARGDWGGFAGSLGVVLPGTAAMVYVAGSASFTREQLIAVGAGSYYVLTVALNKAFGLRGLGGGLSAAPVPGGGAIIGVHRPLGAPAR